MKMKKKYELVLEDSINYVGHKLFRVRALRNFGNVKEGELGGYIEKEENLSHSGNSWVAGNAMVLENAKVIMDARVGGNSLISGNTEVAVSLPWYNQ